VEMTGAPLACACANGAVMVIPVPETSTPAAWATVRGVLPVIAAPPPTVTLPAESVATTTAEVGPVADDDKPFIALSSEVHSIELIEP